VPQLFAEAQMSYNYPTVVLPNSAYISSINCTNTGLVIDFNNPEAYQFVNANWTTNNGEGFLLITYSLECNLAQDGYHVYWLVDALSYDDATQSVTATAEEVATADALGNVSLIWGYTAPANATTTTPPAVTFSGTPGQGATGSTSTGSTNATLTAPTNATLTNTTLTNTTLTNTTLTNTTLTTGNVTTITNTTSLYNCTNPPPSYLGLPTAPCGPNFDSTLDAEIGYLDFDNDYADAIAEYAPGTTNSTASRRRAIAAHQVREFRRNLALQKRWSLKSVFKSAVSAVSSVATKVVSTVATVA
jgi:hypothetical protein